MMNRALLQRQMFANGGAAVPNKFKGFSKLPEEVQMKMNPTLAKKYEEGGNVTPQTEEDVATGGFDPTNPYNIVRFFRDNPGTTVSDYNSFFGTSLDPKEYGIFEKPKPMQEGGVAGLMTQPDMAAMPMGSTQESVDPAVLETALQGASEEVGDLEQAGDFKSMMDQFSGEEKSEEERRDDLASIVGQEDAAQTPDSVLALVTPVVQISMLDQGIAPMAQEAMDTPVEGDMAGGIMSMTGAGNEPPVNFNQGGEVLRRGDEDPVQFFANENLNRVAGPMNTPESFAMNQLAMQNLALARNQKNLQRLAELPKVTPARDLKTIFKDKQDLYSGLLGDSEEQKKLTQSQILFDIANTALAFAAPMPGEKPGMSAAERLAMAASTTKLPQTIGARAAQLQADKRKLDLAALQAAETTQAAEKKQETEMKKKLAEVQSKTTTLKQGEKLFNFQGDEIASGGDETKVLKPGDKLINMETNQVIKSVPLKPVYKTLDGELVKVTETSSGTTTEKIFGEKKDKSLDLYRIVYADGNEVVVDGNSPTGIDAINNKGPNADIFKVGTETKNKIVPRAFLLKDQKKIVTSFDGGQTYHDGKNVFAINPANAIPISPEKSFEVYSSTKIQNNAQKALQGMNDKDFDKLFTKDLPPEIKKTWPEVKAMIKDGTGFYSNLRAAMLAAEGFVPDIVKPSDFLGVGTPTIQARQYLKTIIALGRSALVKNNKFPVREMEFVAGLFVDPDKIFTDGDNEIKRMVNFKQTLIAQKNYNLKLLTGPLDSTEAKGLLTNNNEIDRLLFMLGGYDTKAAAGSSGMTQDNRKKILDQIIKAPGG